MEIKKLRSNAILGLTMLSIFFFSCQNDEAVKTEEIPSSSVQQSEDGTEQNLAVDEAIDIVSGAFENSNMRTLENEEDDPCNMEKQVDMEMKTITFTFNGDNCAGTRKREGTITAKLVSDVKWYQEGGTIEINFDDFKVTRKSDNKSITINGNHIVYNVSGIANPLVHTMHGALSVKFDNGTARDWVVSRKRTISFSGDVTQVKVESDSGNFVTEIGINREGKEFITTIPDPVVVQNCSSGANGYKVIAGKIVYTVGEASLSVGFGYTSLTEKAEDCTATGSVLTYADKTTLASKYYPYKQ